MDYNSLSSSVHGIVQARIVEWVAISSSRGSSQPRDRALVYCTARQIFLSLSHPGSPCVCVSVWRKTSNDILTGSWSKLETNGAQI